MKKETIKEMVIRKLKTGWYSNFQINMECKSSSADREMRRIKHDPPDGRKIIFRKKQVPEGYNPCNEYTMIQIS